MRSLKAMTVLGSLALAGGLSAQSLAEHAAAAAGATVGTAAGKPISNAISTIFSQTDRVTATAAGAKDKGRPAGKATIADEKAPAAKQSGSPAPASAGGGGGGALSSAGASIERHNARPSRAAAQHSAPAAGFQNAVAFSTPVAVEPPRKEPTVEELASIKLGTTQRELQAALGTPASHVIVPDDDGHLRESCQYWSNGRQIGTVRLDNGQVVKVDVIAQN